MKRPLLLTFFAIATACCAFGQDIPTADQLIDKYLTAIGGKEAVAKIEDLTLSMSGESQRNGQPFLLEMEAKYKKPNKSMSVAYAFGQEVSRTTCNGEKVASVRNMMGNQQSTVAEGNEAAMQILQGALFPEMLYEQYKIQKMVVGKDTAAGKEAWKVEFATTDGKKWFEFFDVVTGLKIRRIGSMEGRPGGQRGGGGAGASAEGQRPAQGGQRGPGGGGMMGVTFGDYKEIKDGGGVKIPFTRQQGAGGFSMKITVSSAKANKGIKESNFEIK